LSSPGEADLSVDVNFQYLKEAIATNDLGKEISIIIIFLLPIYDVHTFTMCVY